MHLKSRLTEQLDAKDAHFRKTALEALLTLPSEALVSLSTRMVQMLNEDSDPAVCKAAVEVIASMPTEAIIELKVELVQQLTTSHSHVRRAVCETLMSVDYVHLVDLHPQLVEMLRDTIGWVGKAALTIFGHSHSNYFHNLSAPLERKQLTSTIQTWACNWTNRKRSLK